MISESPSQRQQISFLVRLWREGSPTGWRASVRHIQSEEELFFPSIERLFAHLIDALPAETK